MIVSSIVEEITKSEESSSPGLIVAHSLDGVTLLLLVSFVGASLL